MSYQDQILTSLAALSWELSEVVTDGDWWLDEAWRLQSVGEAFGRELFVTFIVDPMWGGKRKKGQGVSSVRASREPLADWNDISTSVAELFLSKRRFDTKLAEFQAAVREFQQAV